MATRKRSSRTRRNAPASVAVFGGRRGHVMSNRVVALTYYHADSAGRTPYRHDFESAGVQMIALPDGTILLRHPTKRLWEDRLVDDDA